MECELDSVKCLEVFWVFVIHCDRQKHRDLSFVRDAGRTKRESPVERVLSLWTGWVLG